MSMDSKFDTLIKDYSKIASQIENNASQLEESYSKQPSAQAYCTAYEQCVQSLASLLKHTETLCSETTNLLNTHGNAVQKLSDDICELLLEVKLNREMSNRKVIGERTIVKQKPHKSNVVMPSQPYVINKVINTSLDISRYDGVGHGVSHSSKVPATRTTTVELHVPSSVSSTIFKETIELDIDANCDSSFWRIDDNSGSSSPSKVPTINTPARPRPSSGSKGSKRQTASSHKNTILKKNSTFRKRNSLTIKASAPNDISDDIYNSMLNVKSYQATLNVGSGTGSAEDDFMSGNPSEMSLNTKRYDSSNTDAQPSGTINNEDDFIEEEPLSISDHTLDDANPMKFPTPSSTTPSDSNSNIPAPPPPPMSNSSTTAAAPPPPPPPPAPTTAAQPTFLYKARVLYAYEKTLDDEMTIEADSIIEVIEEGEDGWCFAKHGNNTGSVPGNYLQRI